MLIAFRGGGLAVFLYGFAKSERQNIGPAELATLKDLSGAWLKAGHTVIESALAEGVIVEVRDDREEN
jgi:hypothetical protein